MLSRRRFLGAALALALAGCSPMPVARRLLMASGGSGSGFASRLGELLGFINGCPTSAYQYVIGPVFSSDGGITTTAGATSAIGPGGSTWRTVYVKDPWVIWDGTQHVMYMCGWNNSNFQVGIYTNPNAILNPYGWTEHSTIPLLGVPNDGGWRQSGALFPHAIWVPDDPLPLKLWVSGSNAGVITVGYLEGSDAFTITNDHGTVIPLGASGEQDDTWTITPTIYLDDWLAGTGPGLGWYAGYDATTGFMKSMGFTFTDPTDASTYTKTGVVSGFAPRLSVGGFDWRSNLIRQVMKDGSRFLVTGGLWNPGGLTGPPTDTEEACFSVSTTSLAAIPTPTELLVALDDGSWKANSAENVCFLRAA